VRGRKKQTQDWKKVSFAYVDARSNKKLGKRLGAACSYTCEFLVFNGAADEAPVKLKFRYEEIALLDDVAKFLRPAVLEVQSAEEIRRLKDEREYRTFKSVANLRGELVFAAQFGEQRPGLAKKAERAALSKRINSVKEAAAWHECFGYPRIDLSQMLRTLQPPIRRSSCADIRSPVSDFRGLGINSPTLLETFEEQVKKDHLQSTGGWRTCVQQQDEAALAELGLKLRHVEGDGGCLFRAVADQLGWEDHATWQ
ncbi:unnamed protein product, partial [Symbiodinium sp. KB8]